MTDPDLRQPQVLFICAPGGVGTLWRVEPRGIGSRPLGDGGGEGDERRRYKTSREPPREIRRRTRVVGTFPDGNSALMLVTARLKCVADSEWGSRRYLDVSLLDE